MFDRSLYVRVVVQVFLGLSSVSTGLIVTPAQAQEQHSAGFAVLQSQQLEAMLRNKDFLFVNVHIPYAGEIENTDVFIPYDKIADNLGKLPKDKNAPIVLYCRSGHMSEMAAQQLADLGYTHVSHLNGGMIAWKKSGHPVIQK